MCHVVIGGFHQIWQKCHSTRWACYLDDFIPHSKKKKKYLQKNMVGKIIFGEQRSYLHTPKQVAKYLVGGV